MYPQHHHVGHMEDSCWRKKRDAEENAESSDGNGSRLKEKGKRREMDTHSTHEFSSDSDCEDTKAK